VHWGGVNSHAETIELNFGPSTTSGLPTNFATKETNVDFNGYTLTMYQTKWQKSKENSYIAFAKLDGASLSLPSFPGKIITSIAITCQSTTKSKFDLFENGSTTALHQFTFSAMGDKGIQTFNIPEAKQAAGIAYKFVTANTGNQCGIGKITLTLEEAGDPSKTDVELDWGVKEVNVLAGEELKAPALTVTPAEAKDAVVYTSSNEAVAKFVEGNLTLTGFGTTEITAEIKDNETYNNASATYTLTYAKKNPELHFEREVRYGKLGVGVVWEAAKHVGDGAVTYASSNPEIVAVNATTGQILPEDVKAVGTVTITATAAATETYAEATADYEIVIQDPSSAETSGGQFMFDFQVKDPYGMTSHTGSTTDDFDTEDKTITEDKVSLVLKGKRRSYGSSSYDLRFSKGASFTILVPAASYLIEKITINTTADFTISQGSTSTGEGDEKGLKIWSPGSEQINEVTFTWPSNADGTAKVKTITVVYKNKNADLQIADLSFTQTVYNTTVGVETEVNAVNNPNNVATTYSIDCLNPDEYTLTEADGKLAITVDKVGVYTLRAKSDVTDTYLPGIAILRLNVFPQVDFLINGGPTTPVENFIDLPEGGGNIAFGELPVTVDLYYLDEVSEPAAPAALAELDKNDFNLYDGTPVEFANPGTLHYFMRYADAYDSPIYSLGVKVNGQSSGIENVAAEATDAPVEYFNLQGIRVENPVNGLYIRRQGNTASKVIVK
jgi:hypothetical protein